MNPRAWQAIRRGTSNRRTVRAIGAALFMLALAPSLAPAADWASWRGAQHLGVSTETGLVSSWSPQGENLIWKVPFIGRSTPVIVEDRVCVIGRVGEGIDKQEVVACYDAASGRLRWEQRFNVYQTTVPFNRVGWASLAADPETGYVYAQGVAGQVLCFDRRGAVVWQRFPTEELGRYSGYGGRTQTPAIAGDSVIINGISSSWGEEIPLRQRYWAFDKRNGDLVWVTTTEAPPRDFNTQSNPVVTQLAGRDVIVAGGADGFVYALDAHTGEILWKFLLSKRGLNSTVLVHDDRVYACHSEENLTGGTMGGCVAIDGTGRGDVTATAELWRNSDLSVGFPSPAYRDGRLYLIDNSANLHAVDAATGRVVWDYSLGTVGKASPVLADGKLFATEVNGRVHILTPGPEGAVALDMDEVKMEDGRYAEIYGSPAIAYGRVYIATETGLFCIGDKSRPVKAARAARAARPAQGKGDAATALLVPAEVVLAPGESQRFDVRTFDAGGRPLEGRSVATWELSGLTGTIDERGRFTAGGDRIQTGTITAKLGGIEARARVRVFPPLPWTEDFSTLGDDKTPPHWINAAGKFVGAELAGERVLQKSPRERGLNRTTTYIGPHGMHDYTIEADVMARAHRRRRADVGLVAGGYILDLQGAHEQLEVRSWTAELRMAKQAPFAWKPDTWYRMKLRVDVGKGGATVRGKAWPRDQAEPGDWQIVVVDPHPIVQGAPGLVAYSPVDVFYDNLKLTVNE